MGFYGKKLIISSATLPESLIESFCLAYSTGYKRFQRYADKPNSMVYMGLFTHIEALNQVSAIMDARAAKTLISTFFDQFYQAIQQEPVKRRASVLDISAFLQQNLKTHDPQHVQLAP